MTKQGITGKLYPGEQQAWLAIVLLPLLAARSAQAQTFTTLHSFDNTDGSNPNGLVQATDRNLYGTTYLGGANAGCGYYYGCGTVFKISPNGTLTALHTFDGADGEYPAAGLVQATDGNFYGIVSAGGANGAGTVFKITSTGTLTTLYSFCSQGGCPDGELPEAALVQATDGNLYGTSFGGGANGSGTVFEITPSGTLTTVYSFCAQSGCTDGSGPVGLVQANDGNLYGTTAYGGGQRH
jgi:uncharacterized repeat protein (TIGR03803 family)